MIKKALDFFDNEKNKKFSYSLLELASLYQFQVKYEDSLIQYKICTITDTI